MSDWAQKFEKAIGPLSWGFNEGDDGTLITLALQEAESLLRELATLASSDAEDLPDLLREGGVDEDEVKQVERLFEVSRQGSYGEGLSEEGAKEASGIAEDVAALLETFAEEHQSDEESPPTPTETAVAPKARAKRAKKVVGAPPRETVRAKRQAAVAKAAKLRKVAAKKKAGAKQGARKKGHAS